MLYILYIATTLVGDEHLFQIRANVLFVLLYRLEIKFSYSYSYSLTAPQPGQGLVKNLYQSTIIC